MVMIFSLIFIWFLFTHICEVRWTWYLVCESLHIIWTKGWLLPTLCRRRDLGCSRAQGGLKSPPKPNEPLKALTQRITSTVRSAKAREGKSWNLKSDSVHSVYYYTSSLFRSSSVSLCQCLVYVYKLLQYNLSRQYITETIDLTWVFLKGLKCP